jgi:hypothetical protein
VERPSEEGGASGDSHGSFRPHGCRYRKRFITYSFIHKLLSLPGKNTPVIISDHQMDRLKFKRIKEFAE